MSRPRNVADNDMDMDALCEEIQHRMSDTIAWDNVASKPSSFPPSAHSHTYDEISGKPSSFPPSAHSHAYEDISGKPATFASSPHSHAIADVTGLQTALDAKPAVYGAGSVITAPKILVRSAALTVAGSVVIYLTDTALIGGAALFSTIHRIDCGVYDATTMYAFNPVVSNGNKTLTITVNRSSTPLLALLGLNILAAPSAAPIGTSVNVTVFGS